MVSGSAAFLGVDLGGNGTATVSSGTWDNTFVLVGVSGTGALNVSGGHVSGRLAYLGFYGTATGTATVTAGSWDNVEQLYVGYLGRGALNVAGGRVTNLYSFLGDDIGTLGTATVSSGTWLAEVLEVWTGGTGLLQVSDTGVVSVTGTVTGGCVGYDFHGQRRAAACRHRDPFRL